MSNERKTEQVPAAALRFVVGDVELGDNGEGAKTAPFRMVARSGQPIEHWYWGNVVHDLSGMRHRGRVPIDYAHDESQVIGYANKFSTESGDLVVSGALVPYKDDDTASRVVHLAKNGVPFEASINFGGDGIAIERVDEGQSTQVNGYEFSGPGVVVREWPLRGVAVCPYGADGGTSTEFSQDDKREVTVMSKMEWKSPDELKEEKQSTELSESAVAEVEEADAKVEATAVDTAAEVDEENAEAPVGAVEAEKQLSEGQRFLTAFGDRGGVWFAEGRSFEEAQALYLAEIRQENEELREQLANLSQIAKGADEPVSYSDPEPKPTALSAWAQTWRK